MTWIASTEAAIAEPTPTEAAYLAGIMDGEGCFAVGIDYRYYRLVVSMADRTVIDWLHAHYGGHVGPAGRTKAGTQMWRWSAHRQADLRVIAAAITPHLVAKRAQAEAFLRLLDHLGSPPTWDVPTRNVGTRKRRARAAERDAWRARRAELCQAVRSARLEVAA